MKIEKVAIRNFKRFENDLEIEVKNAVLGETSNRFLILGDNGTGKSTLLQAIALTLDLAMGRIRTVADFDWIGFLPGRYFRWGPPHVELTVVFTEDELEATRAVAKEWYETQTNASPQLREFVEPGYSRTVHLTLHGDRCTAATPSELYQFRGRWYATQLVKRENRAREWFARLPGIFWFDQYRSLGLVPPEGNGNGTAASVSREKASYEVGVASLRHFLAGWLLAKHSRKNPYEVDYLDQLESLYQSIFHGRSFAGVEPMPGTGSVAPEDYYFLFTDGARVYDIEEMSAGEQMVFPILYEFVRQQIMNSVVLIDEVDLNLHPPLAQLLVSRLPRLAPTCQFILTTHSAAVSDIISQDETYRLLGGALCL